ncbi:MAG: hypothetical protein ACRBDL_11665 [Alphaproteobacteria bacterium]
MNKDTKEEKLTPEEEKAHIQARKESAQLQDQVEQFDEEYKKLSKKHPLKKSKSKYSN